MASPVVSQLTCCLISIDSLNEVCSQVLYEVCRTDVCCSCVPWEYWTHLYWSLILTV
jgi:hypothetical protein